MKVEMKVEVHLVLSIREAELLRAYVQNPCVPPEDESKEFRELRVGIFNSLTQELISGNPGEPLSKLFNHLRTGGTHE